MKLDSRVFIIALLLGGCANESVYRGGIGAFKDYDSLKAYRAINNVFNISEDYFKDPTDVFDNIGKNFTASNAPIDSFSGGSSSLMFGMRESEAIQRATMRPYTIAGKTYKPHKVKIGDTFEGIASWYGPDFHSKATSNGETYNMYAHTAASKTLPMNTILKVYNKENGKTTIVRINDRGPFVEGRIIDLSNVAARDIQMVDKGTAKVKIEVIGFGGQMNASLEKSLDSKPESNQTAKKETKQESSLDYYSLQVGAFGKLSGAESIKDKFDKLSRKNAVKIVEKDGLYRVYVTGFKSEDEALDFAQDHNVKPIVIKE